jgi:hypothetical protein
MPKSVANLGPQTSSEEELRMWNAPASVLCGCLAVLSLIGCAGDITAPRQAAAVTPAAVETARYYGDSPRVYAAGPAAPAAVLVFLPAMGPASGEDALPRDPALWAAQGFDVVMPQPSDIFGLAAERQAALARLVASAEALADTPIWLVGPSPAIDAVLATAPQLGHGQVSGVVVTSVNSGSGNCSESFSYYDSGTGAPPQVEVRKSGDCDAGLPAITGRQPSILPAPPAPRPNAPRIIEASAVPNDLPPAVRARRLAQLIKASPSG